MCTEATEATLFELVYENGKSVRKTYKQYTDPVFWYRYPSHTMTTDNHRVTLGWCTFPNIIKDRCNSFYQNISDLESVIEKNILKNERVIVFMCTEATEATLIFFFTRSHAKR